MILIHIWKVADLCDMLIFVDPASYIQPFMRKTLVTVYEILLEEVTFPSSPSTKYTSSNPSPVIVYPTVQV